MFLLKNITTKNIIEISVTVRIYCWFLFILNRVLNDSTMPMIIPKSACTIKNKTNRQAAGKLLGMIVEAIRPPKTANLRNEVS